MSCGASKVCAGTSGGHFHPAVTLMFMATKKITPLKALRSVTFNSPFADWDSYLLLRIDTLLLRYWAVMLLAC